MSKAYIYTISANGKDGTHSISPSWVLTFVRWENRYLNLKTPEEKLDKEAISGFLQTRKPLVVDSDCVSVSVSYSKESHTPSMQALLYSGNVNYLTAIAPGDFVLVNMLNFPQHAREIAIRAYNLEPINGVSDGFKGVFKVQSVRRVLTINPASGTKTVMFQVTGFAFTEFNNTLYFNPFLLTQKELGNDILFASRISEVWEQYVGDKGILNVQNIIRLIIDASIGTGFNPKEVNRREDLKITQNKHFYIPSAVGYLLGVPKAEAAKDIYNYLFGIQTYSSAESENTTFSDGMNPVIKSVKGRYYLTGQECQGWSFVKAEYWNQVTVWSILNQYTNAPINELFVTLRVDTSGSVMPTVVFRQMPFSSEAYKGISTKFLNLPRWKIDPELLLNINLGRDETARINFVQVFGILPNVTEKARQGSIAQQIAGRNYVADELDIRRSGLRPYIITSNFDNNVTDKQANMAPKWARLLADSLIGGQLKLNGSIECQGIVEPIAVGDNLQLDGVVYHVEAISHRCTLTPDGKKSFTTSIEISHGIDIRSEIDKKIFPQMNNIDMQKEQEKDYNILNNTLPGISHEQYALGEISDPAKDVKKEAPFNSYVNEPDPKPEKREKIDKGRSKK
jgi:hypothetical protein